ncbi:MAG TPA: ABC transporter ATP-binding protein [Ghiorsea sp.]|nr:ABC transporter ATP-binding protein [Ghiorsea sp.]HIP07400.1 ABC transporter ATP-binding protein [Mariprofundaceae bacterium]
MSQALEVKQLTKTYSNGKEALQGVDLSVPEGSFFALLGPNGAGKSSLINILADTVKPSSGEVTFLGHDLFTERRWCKQRLGVVPQEIAFDPFFNPRDILKIMSGMFGVKPDLKWIDELLERLELSEHAHKNARMLSGGMRRRLLVAQALVHRPKVVILDEPTAGVDVELRKRLWGFMRELNANGTTILLTTHYLEEAEELCDHVAIIDQGKLLTSQSMKGLLDTVGSSALALEYTKPISEQSLLSLAEFSPRLDGNKVLLCLKKDDSGQNNFNAAYQTAISVLGEAKSVSIQDEDLEDVFLRLTNERKT